MDASKSYGIWTSQLFVRNRQPDLRFSLGHLASRQSRLLNWTIWGFLFVPIMLMVPLYGWFQQAGTPLAGGMGYFWLSQFANPSLVGALYMTPTFPWTGTYPIFPGTFSELLPSDTSVEVGPLRLHPFMGMAEMY